MKSDKIFIIVISLVAMYLLLDKFLPDKNLQNVKQMVNQLNHQNDSLKRKNDSIYIQLNGLAVEKQLSKDRIDQLINEQEDFKRRLTNLNSKYQQLKGEYEKAKNHAANFTSADIQRYFADSLR